MTARGQKRLLFLVSVILFIFFVIFSYFVAKEYFTQFDFDTTVKIQDRISHKADWPFSVLSVLGTAELTGLVWLIILLLLLFKRFFLTAFSMFLLPFALAIEVFGKLFVLHPGPPHLFYRGVIKFDFPSHFVPVDYSYPSGHVMRTAFLVLFFITILFLKFTGIKKYIAISFFAVFLLAMVVSRIYLGEHWFTDVMGGLLLGSSFGILAGTTLPLKNNQDTITKIQK